MPKARIFWAAGVLCLAAVAAIPSARALDIRVQGQATLQLDARAAGTRLTASGQLIDDLGKPLPQRGVEVILFDASGSEVQSWLRTTDRHGRFRVSTDADPGSYRWVASFATTSHVEGTTGTARVTAQSAPVDLSVRAPGIVRVSGEASVPVTVQASVDGSGLEVPVSIRVDGRAVGRVELGPDGRGQLDIASYVSPGERSVSAEIAPGEHRDAAETSTSIRAVRDPSVEVTFEPVITRLQRGFEVSGRVTDRAGPVAKMSVTAELLHLSRGGDQTSEEPGPTRRLQTDASGRFQAFIDRGALSRGMWQARVEATPDVGESVVARSDSLERESGLSGGVLTFAAGLAMLALLTAVGREAWGPLTRWLEKRRTSRQRKEAREKAFKQQEDVEVSAWHDEGSDPPADPGSVGVGGVVWDPWRSKPVAGAAITLENDGDVGATHRITADDSGHFELVDVSEGTWTLRLNAPGFVEATGPVRLPHDGEYSGARFDLVAVPLKIRRMYQALVEYAEGRDLWGSLSPREIEASVQSVLGSAEERTGERAGASKGGLERRLRRWLDDGVDDLETAADYLRALTDIVEETYYSNREYREETWHLARHLAVELRDAIEEGAGA
jgi:uncharacterized GH25 family protein